MQKFLPADASVRPWTEVAHIPARSCSGAMIGLRVQQRDNAIFVSYRATDGKSIAVQLEEYLKNLGYPVWLDEAKELDGETKILPGTEVQSQIDEALAKSSILLLLDTPDAPHSRWITHEVETANGLLLPILPLCFRAATDGKKGPRFPSAHNDNGRLAATNALVEPMMNWRREIEEFTECSDFPNIFKSTGFIIVPFLAVPSERLFIIT